MAYKTIYPKGPKEKIVVARKQTHFLRNFLVLVVVCLIGVGFYAGWFVLSTHEEPQTHKTDVKLTVDTDKIKQDAKNAAEKTKEEAAALSAKAKEEANHLRQSK